MDEAMPLVRWSMVRIPLAGILGWGRRKFAPMTDTPRGYPGGLTFIPIKFVLTNGYYIPGMARRAEMET